MGEVAGEIVGAELVFGIEALVLEVSRPLLQRRPVEPGEIRVAFHLGQGAEQQQQVPAFLDRHLVVLGALATAVNLAVGVRILAEVMWGEREAPAVGGGVVHERDEERLGQRRPEEQELRRHRIEKIRGADAAIAVVFLAELEGLAVGVRHELAGGEALAVGQGDDARVLLAARLDHVGPQLGVEGFAALDQVRIIAGGRLEQVSRLPAIAPPVRTQIALHVLDRIQVVVGQHQPARGRFAAHPRRTESQREREPDIACRRRCFRRFRRDGLGVLDRGARGGQVKEPPVDADVVTALGEDRLVFRTGAQDGEPAHARHPVGQRQLVRRIGGEFAAGGEPELDLAGLAIGRVGRRGDIGDRAREDVEVVGQGRGEECQLQGDALAGKRIDRLRGGDLESGLRQGRQGGGFFSHHAELPAVDPDHGRQAVRLAGPVGRVHIRQLVSRRPDREIRVAGHQRHRRRAQGGEGFGRGEGGGRQHSHAKDRKGGFHEGTSEGE